MPPLMDASQNVVPDSMDSNAISNYSESPEFLSDPLPTNVRRDIAIVSKLWGDDAEGIEPDPSPKGVRPQDEAFTIVLSKSQIKKLK